MSAALGAGADEFPPHCQGRASPRGGGADEHVRRAAEVERHRGATAGSEADEHVRRAVEVERHRGATAGSEADDLSAALPRSRADPRNDTSRAPTLSVALSDVILSAAVSDR